MAKSEKKKLEEAGKFSKIKFEDLSKGQKNKKSKVRKYNKMWRGQPVDRHYTGGMANLVVNEMHKIVETYVSLQKRLRTIAQPSMRIREQKKLDNLKPNDDRLLEILSLTEYQLNKCKADTKFERVYRKLGIEGMVWYKVPWDVTKTKYSSYKPKIEEEYAREDAEYGVVKEGATKKKEYKLIPTEIEEVFDSPNIVVKRLENMYYDQKIMDWWKQPAIGEKEEKVRFESLLLKKDKDGKQLYKGLKKLKEKLLANVGKQKKQEGIEVELFHLWAKYDPDGNGITQVYEIICEMSTWTCILCRVNPYDHGTIPYRAVKFLEVDGRADGMGLCELLYRQQIEINDNRNKINDTITMGLARQKIVRRGANIPKEQLKTRPDNVIETLDPQRDVKTLDVDYRAVEFGIMLERLLKEDIQTTSGATMPLQGTGAGAETLGQSEIMLQRGLEKALNILDRVDNDLHKEVYRLFYSLSMQYREAKWEIMILGREAKGLKSVSKLEIFADVIFEPLGAKELRYTYLQRQQDQALMQTLLGTAMPRYIPVVDMLLEKIAEASGRGREFKDAMKKGRQAPAVSTEGGGETAQAAAGATGQVNETGGVGTLMRGAGNPMRNQST